MLKNISIRTKITLAPILIITLVSVFIYTYYPEQQKHRALEGIESEIKSIGRVFSIGVGIGMGDADLVAVSEALQWAQSDSSVVYISVVDDNGLSITTYDPHKIQVPAQIYKNAAGELIEENRTIFSRIPINYQNTSFGTLVVGYSLQKRDMLISDLKNTTLYFCIAMFIVGVFFSFLISSRITSGIRKLDNAVRAVRNGGTFNKVKIDSNDEIGKFSIAFNRMLENLNRSHQHLVDYSHRLEKQNKELNQFSYVVSHDLKAPLRAIFKLSQWIEEDIGKDIPADTLKNMQILRGRVFRLEGLINGLLEYSRIGKINFQSERTDVSALISEVLDLLNTPENAVINIQSGMPIFTTKKILLHQVFLNLISNALKYNDKKIPEININAADKGEFYEFSVNDNGPGIEKEYHEKIFMIFQTLEARDKVESTGVGLAIVRKSVEDIGGTIRIMSEKGKGSTFIFSWPKESNPKTASPEILNNHIPLQAVPEL
jgi:signal transduction histidine kinase